MEGRNEWKCYESLRVVDAQMKLVLAATALIFLKHQPGFPIRRGIAKNVLKIYSNKHKKTLISMIKPSDLDRLLGFLLEQR
jgi:hypothetical protein